MRNISSLYTTEYSQNKQHTLIIYALDAIKIGTDVSVTVFVDEELVHNDSLNPFSAWIKVYFHAYNSAVPIEVGGFNFASDNLSDIKGFSKIDFNFTTDSSGTIYATSYCSLNEMCANSMSVSFD